MIEKKPDRGWTVQFRGLNFAMRASLMSDRTGAYQHSSDALKWSKGGLPFTGLCYRQWIAEGNPSTMIMECVVLTYQLTVEKQVRLQLFSVASHSYSDAGAALLIQAILRLTALITPEPLTNTMVVRMARRGVG
ncbi:hypothetical protein LIA77_03287 [Sarocladium implicatum]|nr:hypothetical protein LIA77_03287 [Sarocladium implicatum]